MGQIEYKKSMILLEKEHIKRLQLEIDTRDLCDTIRQRREQIAREIIIENLERSIKQLETTK